MAPPRPLTTEGESRVLRGPHPLARTSNLSFGHQIVDFNEEKGGEEEDPVLVWPVRQKSELKRMRRKRPHVQSLQTVDAERPCKCRRLVDVHE
jgi:hypothetical protein